jgi:alkanesulfonate monooxygenase SsuD/methylene tetrahydromethanopterin reductase-like flavin-dependent oxidoreductase (luciferase family)
LKRFRDARTAHGHTTEPEVLAVYHFYCGETNEKAREEAREAMLRYLRSAAEPNQEAAYSAQYAGYEKLSEGFKRMDYDAYLYPHRLIVGDPDQCAERIAEIRATGVTNVGLIANFGGLEHAKVLASLDRFAKHVIPRFR